MKRDLISCVDYKGQIARLRRLGWPIWTSLRIQDKILCFIPYPITTPPLPAAHTNTPQVLNPSRLNSHHPRMWEVNLFRPANQNRYLCKQCRSWWDGLQRAVSSGSTMFAHVSSESTLFAILIWFLTGIPISNNEHVEIKWWKSPFHKLHKLRVETINEYT